VTAVRFVDEGPWGFGWIHPEPSFMQRTSHALLVEGRVWLVDPTDGEGVEERVRGLGDPAGVVQLLDRHGRDCAALAERLGVPLHVVPDAAPAGAPFELVPVVRRRRWREDALWLPAQRLLVATEVLGSAPYYRAPGERLAVHPLLRLTPPRKLLRFEPEHVLTGHGEGVHEDATAALRDAIRGSRRRLPAWAWAGLRAHVLHRSA
jgi:hypothetical protein